MFSKIRVIPLKEGQSFLYTDDESDTMHIEDNLDEGYMLVDDYVFRDTHLSVGKVSKMPRDYDNESPRGYYSEPRKSTSEEIEDYGLRSVVIPESGFGIWDMINDRMIILSTVINKEELTIINQVNSGSKISIHTNSQGDSWDVYIELGTDKSPKMKQLCKFLSEEDAQYLIEKNSCDMAFIDCETANLIPLRKKYRRIEVGDYVITTTPLPKKMVEGTVIKCTVKLR